MKMTVFWDAASCSLPEITDVSEVLTMIRVMSPMKSLSVSLRLHGAASQETSLRLQQYDPEIS
jgi:hypothetical protein